MRQFATSEIATTPLAVASPDSIWTLVFLTCIAGTEGQTFAEYMVILAVVVLVAVIGFSSYGNAMSVYLTNASNAIIASM